MIENKRSDPLLINIQELNHSSEDSSSTTRKLLFSLVGLIVLLTVCTGLLIYEFTVIHDLNKRIVKIEDWFSSRY